MQNVFAQFGHSAQSSPWETAVVSFAGVLLGGLISLFSAMYLNARANRKSTLKDGLIFVSNATSLINDIASIHRPIMNQINMANLLFQSELYWQAILPFVSSRDASFISPAESIHFAMEKMDDETLNKFTQLINLRNTLVAALDYYSKSRLELSSLLDEHSTIEEDNPVGGLMKTEFTSTGNAGLIRRIGEIRGIAKELVELASEAMALAYAFSEHVNTKLHEQYPKRTGLFGRKIPNQFPYRLAPM
ncbi:hypothetical protein [uncultured Maricaulis sp.]|uniref:hypothetical protein n=1 Tax=uncultured Maricaulis sp. TaxID=174710 RepID=UPI00261783F8|nr:hypothetical protein [uncultured Maricaulis sp.]